MPNKIILKTILAANIVLQATPVYAHNETAGEGSNKLIEAFNHFPPDAHDAKYYLGTIFILALIALVVVQFAKKYSKKKG